MPSNGGERKSPFHPYFNFKKYLFLVSSTYLQYSNTAMGGEHKPLHQHGNEWHTGLFSCPDTGNCMLSSSHHSSSSSSCPSLFLSFLSLSFRYVCMFLPSLCRGMKEVRLQQLFLQLTMGHSPVAINIIREGY